MKHSCFKTCDVRGRVPHEFNPEIAASIAAVYAKVLTPGRVPVGYDVRPTSLEIAESVVEALLRQGVDVYQLGMGGTEEVYYAAFSGGLDGGIMVTASHNPAEYNGLKLVAGRGAPLAVDQLEQIKHQVQLGGREGSSGSFRGKKLERDWRLHYVDYLAQMFHQAVWLA